MPLRYRPDSKPVVEFDPRLEVSPFMLFRRLQQQEPPLLVDVRDPEEAGTMTLTGAERLPAGWTPPGDRDVVLFDDDGTGAVDLAARLQEGGHPRVRALFGGLELYAFSLDPAVVGEQTYLVPRSSEGPSRP